MCSKLFITHYSQQEGNICDSLLFDCKAVAFFEIVPSFMLIKFLIRFRNFNHTPLCLTFVSLNFFRETIVIML